MHTNNLFYAALDADSDGVEGKFYCWTKDEINNLLTPLQASIISAYYDITANGNFTEPHHNITTNIMQVVGDVAVIAHNLNITIETCNEELQNAKNILLQHRNTRNAPLTDDKCILAWNALMNKALTQAFVATKNVQYLNLAEQNMEQLLQIFIILITSKKLKTISHTFKNKLATITAFLDDIAFLADALLCLYNVTLHKKYVDHAVICVQYTLQYFKDKESPFFYFTNSKQNDTIVRKKEVYDGATPKVQMLYLQLQCMTLVHF